MSNKITIQIQSETLYIRCNTVLCLAENSANVTEGPGMKTVDADHDQATNGFGSKILKLFKLSGYLQ